jgi:hypothetical protein
MNPIEELRAMASAFSLEPICSDIINAAIEAYYALKGELDQALAAVGQSVKSNCDQALLAQLTLKDAEAAVMRAFIFEFTSGSSIKPSLESARKKADKLLLTTTAGTALLARLRDAEEKVGRYEKSLISIRDFDGDSPFDDPGCAARHALTPTPADAQQCPPVMGNPMTALIDESMSVTELREQLLILRSENARMHEAEWLVANARGVGEYGFSREWLERAEEFLVGVKP